MAVDAGVGARDAAVSEQEKHSSSSFVVGLLRDRGVVQFSLRWLGGRSRLGSIFRDGLETAEDSSWGQVGASR